MKQWLIRNPVVLGVLFAAAALFALKEGIDGAREQRRFAGATPVSAEVVSVTKKSTVPPRWNAEVAWGVRAGARSATVVVGTAGKKWTQPAVAPGHSVEILVAADDTAILARRLKNASLVKLGGFEIDSDEFWIGLMFVAGAVLTLAFAGPIKREADRLFG
jgi:hypothetical protein